MWILVRGIRVDHGARACPQSHDDHVGNHAPHVNHDTTCLRSTQPHHALDSDKKDLFYSARASSTALAAAINTSAAMYDVIATLPTQCGSHACMVVLHAYARRHCMSTARVSAIPTPRSVTSAALPRSLQRDRDVVLPLRISNRTPRRNPPVV